MIKNGSKISGSKPITTQDQLKFYGLYKQATEGSCKG